MKGLLIAVAVALLLAASAGCCSWGECCGLNPCGGHYASGLGASGLGPPHCADCASGVTQSMPPVEFH
ncbi:MAG: hypothetical protein KDA63_00050 [Planctomycetales bacterium]|nr:hypothetical protein [Planctomycetales bacterium]